MATLTDWAMHSAVLRDGWSSSVAISAYELTDSAELAVILRMLCYVLLGSGMGDWPTGGMFPGALEVGAAERMGSDVCRFLGSVSVGSISEY